MRNVCTQLALGAFVLMSGIGRATADEPTSPPPAGDVSPAEIKALIRQLGDRDTAQRDAATRRLIEIGPPAKAQLEAASDDSKELAVIRRKAKVLLLSIVRRERAERWQAFIEGKSADAPPGWKKFSKIVGSTPEARRFFVELYRAEPKLLETYAADPAKAAALIEPLCATRKRNVDDLDREVPIKTLAAYLLVAGERKARFSAGAISGLANMLGFDFSLWAVNISPFVVALKNSPEKPLLRKLVGRWIRNTKLVDDFTGSWLLLAAAELEFKEGLSIALERLEKIKTPEGQKTNPSVINIVVFTIGKLGDATHVQKLEPLLTNTTVIRKTSDVNGRQRTLQVRDVALAALLNLTGQKQKDYAIENADDAFDLRDFMSPHIYFAGDKQRQQAFTKWQTWREQHPTPSPELIYIVSDQPAERGAGDADITRSTVLVRHDCQ